MQDLYSQLRGWHSDYYRPIGESSVGSTTRFESERLDAILDEMAPLPSGEETYELSKEALACSHWRTKSAWLPMFVHLQAGPDQFHYWTNFPGFREAVQWSVVVVELLQVHYHRA